MPKQSSLWPSESDLAAVCGARVKEFREQRALSQRALADEIQISKSMTTKYESGLHTPPASVLVRLARALRATVDSLLGYAGQNPRLVRCLQEIEQMDDETREPVIQALEGIVNAYRVILTQRP
jgi:transcriptional regulator with XRE-family HTH domain